MPLPLPLDALVEPELWEQLPADRPALLDLLPRAELSLQDRAELSLQDAVQIVFPPTLTRVWCRKGRRGQRLVEAPGDKQKV